MAIIKDNPYKTIQKGQKRRSKKTDTPNITKEAPAERAEKSPRVSHISAGLSQPIIKNRERKSRTILVANPQLEMGKPIKWE